MFLNQLIPFQSTRWLLGWFVIILVFAMPGEAEARAFSQNHIRVITFVSCCQLSSKYQFKKTYFPEKGCSFASNNSVCFSCWLSFCLFSYSSLGLVGGCDYQGHLIVSDLAPNMSCLCAPEPPNNCWKSRVTMCAAPSLGLLMVLLNAKHLICWFRKCWI